MICWLGGGAALRGGGGLGPATELPSVWSDYWPCECLQNTIYSTFLAPGNTLVKFGQSRTSGGAAKMSVAWAEISWHFGDWPRVEVMAFGWPQI